MESTYWSKRYQNEETGWDLGEASGPLIQLFKGFKNKNAKILIPGCGNAYEAEYLFNEGYKNIYIIDIAPEPLDDFMKRSPNFPSKQIILGDFFNHHGEYDIIVEQTFFCAINPKMRPIYVDKCHEILNNKGRIIGVLFNREFDGGPPYGGNIKEYESLFKLKFSKVNFKHSRHSIKPRKKSEIEICCEK
ncbi:TPMT family class I SAM-dependent methyltransferase [Crocinitomicaceae bacterium]|nr:TPMT family class I SAM-dependent methyltransferase [Crocinitomicaceae bacterium]